MAPSKKRVKRATKPSKAAADAKAWIVDIPLDILLEIFQLLHPADLVYLSRTSKSFRSFLLDRRKSLQIWRTALSRVEGLPQCPTHLSEPAYANLAFVPLCHGCGVAGCETVKWSLRVRCCSECSTTLLDHIKDVRHLLSQPLAQAHGGHLLLPYDHPNFLKADVENFKELCAGVEDFVALNDIFSQRQSLSNEIREHANMCRQWVRAIQEAREKEKRLIIEKRTKDITERLRKMGWGDELNLIDANNPRSSFCVLPVVRKPKILGDKEWSTIRPTLIQFLEDIRFHNAFKKRFEFLTLIVDDVSKGMVKNATIPIYPRPIDVCFFPKVREVLDVDCGTELTLESIDQAIRPFLSSLFVDWHHGIVDRFKKYVRSHSSLQNDVDLFDRAALILKCKTCAVALAYPAALDHKCLYECNPAQVNSHQRGTNKRGKGKGVATTTQEPLDRSDMYAAVAERIFNTRPWNCEILALEAWDERLSNLFSVFGEDPATVTKVAMEKYDARVSCNWCRGSQGFRTVMTWQTAVNHCITGHLATDDSDVTWTLVTGDGVTKAKELEKKSECRSTEEYISQAYWICNWCPMNTGAPRLYTMRQVPDVYGNLPIAMHVSERHEVTRPIEGRDFRRKLDSPPWLLKPVTIAI